MLTLSAIKVDTGTNGLTKCSIYFFFCSIYFIQLSLKQLLKVFFIFNIKSEIWLQRKKQMLQISDAVFLVVYSAYLLLEVRTPLLASALAVLSSRCLTASSAACLLASSSVIHLSLFYQFRLYLAFKRLSIYKSCSLCLVYGSKVFPKVFASFCVHQLTKSQRPPEALAGRSAISACQA